MKKATIFILSVMLLLSGNSFSAVHYVKPSNAGTGDGSSWDNASNDLQKVINVATGGDEIWVAAGTYVPSHYAGKTDSIPVGGSRGNAFVLKKDIKLYGGFTGSETMLSQRNWNTNVTILSGKLNDNDKTYHVVFSVGDVGVACLDGFKVTEANADDTSGLTTVNGTKTKNKDGAGIHINTNSSPTIKNTIITLNDCMGDGGGLFINWSSNPILENVRVDNNSANGGGGIMVYQSSAPIIINSLIINNQSTLEGGGIRIYGANANIINCTIGNNMASNFGGIYGTKGINMGNTIVWGNTGAKQVTFDTGLSLVICCLVEGTTPAGTRNLNGNSVTPDFVNTDFDNYQLLQGSICIDRGDNAFYTTYGNLSNNVDMDGQKRLSNNAVDLGAYEFQSSTAVQNAKESGISIYPNPAKNQIRLSSLPLNSTIKVLNIAGKVVETAINQNEYFRLNLNLSTGIYFIKIETKEKSFVEKLIIQ